jgi:hypothetical protein
LEEEYLDDESAEVTRGKIREEESTRPRRVLGKDVRNFMFAIED